MLPQNTAVVLQFLFPDSRELVDWEVADNGKETVITKWRMTQPQPADGEIAAAAASSEFAEWLASRADPQKLRRRDASALRGHRRSGDVRDRLALQRERQRGARAAQRAGSLARARDRGRSSPGKVPRAGASEG